MNLVKLKDMKIKLLEIICFRILSKQPFDFRTFETIRSLPDDIYNKRIIIDEVN